jgi:flagellar hook-associated protein 3 FlgL
LSWLSAADTAYSQIVSVVQQARTLVVQGLNTGASAGDTADAIAQQIDGARTAALSLANTSYNGRPIFGGTTAGGTAYDASGNYLGDDSAVTRAVGAQTTVQASTTGPTVFGAAGTDLFTTLSNIAATLRSDPSALTGALAQLDTAISRVSTAQAAAGANFQQVQQARPR